MLNFELLANESKLTVRAEQTVQSDLNHGFEALGLPAPAG
jgi:hypothetical protein